MPATAIVSSIAIIVSILIFAWQAYVAAFRTSVDLVLKLDDQFSDDSFERKRHEVADEYQKSKTITSCAEPIFDFFDLVGFLVRKNAIDKSLAWATPLSLGTWLLVYWCKIY